MHNSAIQHMIYELDVATNETDVDVREIFDRMWQNGYDGRSLALSFVRVAAAVVREENASDITELRRLLD